MIFDKAFCDAKPIATAKIPAAPNNEVAMAFKLGTEEMAQLMPIT